MGSLARSILPCLYRLCSVGSLEEGKRKGKEGEGPGAVEEVQRDALAYEVGHHAMVAAYAGPLEHPAGPFLFSSDRVLAEPAPGASAGCAVISPSLGCRLGTSHVSHMHLLPHALILRLLSVLPCELCRQQSKGKWRGGGRLWYRQGWATASERARERGSRKDMMCIITSQGNTSCRASFPPTLAMSLPAGVFSVLERLLWLRRLTKLNNLR
jgi:hypothetical protein